MVIEVLAEWRVLEPGSKHGRHRRQREGVVTSGATRRALRHALAVELGRIAIALRPLARGCREVGVQTPPLPILLKPAPQPRPLAQQRLMRDLDRAIAHRQQTRVRQDHGHVRDPRVAIHIELGERHPPADDRRPLAKAEAQHDRPRRVLL